jgi:hypothetical protein
MPRLRFTVLSFDEKGNGTARDEEGFAEYTFTGKPGTIDAGNLLTAEIYNANPLVLEEILIEKGRNALRERKQFQSQGDGITSDRTPGRASEEKPSDRTRNPSENIRRKPE